MNKCLALGIGFSLIFLTGAAMAGPLDTLRSWFGHHDQPKQRTVHSRPARHDKSKGDKPDASPSPNPEQSPESAESPGPSPTAVQSPDQNQEDKQLIEPDASPKNLSAQNSHVAPVAIDPPPLY
jgi:hypothetical protein